MSQQQQQQVSDEPLSVQEVSVVHQLINIAFNKAAYNINDAGIIHTLNVRMIAILERDKKEREAANQVPPLKAKAKAKKGKGKSQKAKTQVTLPVVADVSDEDASSDEDSDDAVPDTVRVQ
jgi:hypothetical protein